GPGMVVLDPMCGAGTILAEQVELARRRGAGWVTIWGGDIERSSLLAATANLKRLSPDLLAQWDARRLPLADASVDRIICNPPCGRQLGDPDDIGPLYQQAVREWNRVLKPGGRAVLLVGDPEPLLNAVRGVGWGARKQYRVRVLGLLALISVWQKA